MKSYLLLIFLTFSTLQSQTTFSQTSDKQLDYFKSNINELLEENGIDIITNSTFYDSLTFSGEGGFFGCSVSTAGDVNGDGFSDVIVGASGTRRAYIFFGGSTMDNIADVTMVGETSGDVFGLTVSTAGDVNADGFSDVIVGAEGYANYKGRAYIYYGGLTMNNIADITLTGEATGNYFGYSISTAGDVNADGFSDVIVSAWAYSSRRGRAYIYYGAYSMNNIADVTLTGEEGGNYFGHSVSTAGDVNADGYSDIIVGAYGYNDFTGRAYIFFGGEIMNTIADVTMTGDGNQNYFGMTISTAGDVNGDGYSDVIVLSFRNYLSIGRAYIYYGGLTMNNIADITLTGETADGDFGYSLSTAGDLNVDGYSDVIIGDYGYNSSTGRVYVYYGGSTMDSLADIKMTGETTDNRFGFSVSTAGDVNGDGFSDVIVGAEGYNNFNGQAYLYINLNPKPVLVNPINNSINNPLLINFKWKRLSATIFYILNISIDSNFNNIIVRDTIYSDTSKLVSGFQKNTKYFWKIKAKDTLGNTFNSSTWNFSTIPPLYANVKLLFEGMYSPIFNQLTRKDTTKIYIRNSSSPFALIDSAKSTIDSLSFSGQFNFLNALTGTYYFVVKHFNCIETWSKAGGESITNDGTIYNYDFTSANTQAYWNNLKLKGSKYCLYSGDSNQDGFIDLFDVVPIYNGATNFITGYYLATDLTGDNIIDLSDVTLCYNNSSNFIRVRRP